MWLTDAWRDRLTHDAQRFGPRTCGCVALYLYAVRHLTPTGRTEDAAWPLCPRCLGLGIDLGMTRGLHGS